MKQKLFFHNNILLFNINQLCVDSKLLVLLFKHNKADQQPKPRWNYLGYLEQERQWGPALGLVGGKPTIATGTVFQRAVLEFASLCNERQIETAVLSMQIMMHAQALQMHRNWQLWLLHNA